MSAPPKIAEPAGPGPSPIDRDALVRLDPVAVDQFVRSTVDRVHGLLWRMLGHREDVEDLTQEVYLRAWRALPAYRGEARPETWLYRIAINVGRDEIAKRQVARKRDGGEVDPGRHHAPDDPTHKVLRAEEAAVLETALAELSEDRREIVVLAEIEGMGMDEIAAVLDLPVGTVKSKLFRSRELMRESVKKQLGPVADWGGWP